MTRTLKITLEVVLDHLPADEIDDLEIFAEEQDMTLEKAAQSVLLDASASEIAQCIQQGCFDPELFAGSMLYLRVNEANIISAEWHVASPVSRPHSRSEGNI